MWLVAQCFSFGSPPRESFTPKPTFSAQPQPRFSFLNALLIPVEKYIQKKI
jgi:hypothetical protein